MDKQVIQSTGFRNITDENGNITGFQFKVRLPYYRGLWLSQIIPGTLYVDGEKFDRKDLLWDFDGDTFTYDELHEINEYHWMPNRPVTLKVAKEGGLSQGYHDLKLGMSFTSSYMPPFLESEESLNPDSEMPVYMPEFGKHVNERRLLIV